MTKSQIATIVAAVVAALDPKDQKPPMKKAKPSKAKAAKLPRAQYLLSIKSKFADQGITVKYDAKTDKFVDVLPAKGWIALGRIPAKGQHNINGLFHKSQTNALA